MNENEKYVLSNEDIFSKLALIEKHLTGFEGRIYTPSHNFNPQDIISVQKEASKMMSFVGLDGYIAVISYNDTGENIGGNIELDDSREVFIEIREDYKTNRDQTLAVMAHEICHKVLYVNHLYYPLNRIENELLTDLATVYCGFGVLSLNGCYREFETSEMKQYTNDTIIKTTHKQYIGYLSLRQFAIAFNYIRKLYLIPPANYRMLNYNASIMLNKVGSSFYTNIHYDEFKEKLKDAQRVEAEAKKNIILLSEMINDLKEVIDKNHKLYYNSFIYLLNKYSDTKIIKNQFEANEIIYKLKPNKVLTESSLIINELLSYYSDLHSLNTTKLNNIECPHCGYIKENAVKDKKELFIKCPKCGYLFLWDATPLCKNNIQKDISTTESSEKKTIWDHMRKWIHSSSKEKSDDD